MATLLMYYLDKANVIDVGFWGWALVITMLLATPILAIISSSIKNNSDS